MIPNLKSLSLLFICLFPLQIQAQQGPIQWTKDGTAYTQVEQNEIIETRLPSNEKKVLINQQQITPSGKTAPLSIDWYGFSEDGKKLLIYTNSQKVWRINTRGDYWVLDLGDNSLKKLGKSLPKSSLMFAKFSPDGSKVAYVSEYNIYVEDLTNQTITPLTTDGTRKFINGTFDWVYEEEFACRDGFRWSPDSKSIAYWQLDAEGTGDFLMINNTDSVYSQVIPVEYPKVGQNPSAARIGVIDVATAKTVWTKIEGDPRQHYLVRLEFIPGTNEFLVQQLNRKQNESKILRCNASTGNSEVIHTERDEAWIDVMTPNDDVYAIDYKHPFHWLDGGKEFLWTSEKDGWRHIYRIQTDGKKETLITKGDYDVISMENYDEKSALVYFMASPDNATQKYLYSIKLNGKGKTELITPEEYQGTNNYNISTTGKFALHRFSNSFTRPAGEMINLPKHQALNKSESISSKMSALQEEKTVEFIKIKTEEGIEMDGWMVKPSDFDPSKKYPVLFFVYTEPWKATVVDRYGVAANKWYKGNMREDGYIYISLDNRGTPAPKGREWRKSIYRKIGDINIRDQALAAKEILKWTFVDSERIAVWGHSGGGSATLNLMFQYPEIYQTGIAMAAVANQLTYDNIYQERFMGLPQENLEDFVQGSPITHAMNLKGNLLYIHGTGDDNVHYQNADMLVNELIKHNKQFQFMPYPNRSHGISEGQGTFLHLSTLYTEYLKKHFPPGGR